MRISTVVTALLLVFVAVPAFAQDKPYSPKAASIGQLINLANYQESPIQLQYEELNRTTVTNGPRLDFEHTYAVEFGEFVETFAKAYQEHTAVTALRPESAPHIKDTTIFVVGMNKPSDTARFTLGSKSIPLRFTIDVRPDGDNVIVTVHNAIYSQLFSGIMPARKGYLPTDSKEVPFRWN